MVVKFYPNDDGNPPDKLADAEICFLTGPLAGLKLIGFGVWEKSTVCSKRRVTFPSRFYSVNGERRAFTLLRTASDPVAQDRVKDFVLEAWEKYESQMEESCD